VGACTAGGGRRRRRRRGRCVPPGLDDRQIPSVVQGKADTCASPNRLLPRSRRPRAGRRPRPRDRERPASLKQLALAAGVELIWRRASKGRQHSRFLGWGRSGGEHSTPPGGRPCPRHRLGGADPMAAGPMACHKAEPGSYWRSSRTTASARARSAWILSKAAPGRAGPSPELGVGRPPVPDPGAAAPPEPGGVGRSVWQLLEELQVLLGAGSAPARSAIVGRLAGSVTEDKPARQPDKALLAACAGRRARPDWRHRRLGHREQPGRWRHGYPSPSPP
jgi:hypothetical protein